MKLASTFGVLVIAIGAAWAAVPASALPISSAPGLSEAAAAPVDTVRHRMRSYRRSGYYAYGFRGSLRRYPPHGDCGLISGYPSWSWRFRAC